MCESAEHCCCSSGLRFSGEGAQHCNLRRVRYAVAASSDALRRELPGDAGSIMPQHYSVQPRHTWKPTSGEIMLVVCTGALSLLCCILCTLQFVNHLKNWRSPGLQKCYLRIILVAPIYATFSWFAVLSSRNSGIFDLARSIYETYVLYAFLH